MKKLFLLFFTLTLLNSPSQEAFNLDSPDPAGKANLDLISLSKSASGMEATWLYRPVAFVTTENEEVKRDKVYKKSPAACTGESHTVDGKVISECDGDKSIAYATSLYVIIKQSLTAQGKNNGNPVVIPIALRYFKSGLKYTAEFPEAIPFFSSQKINVDYNMSNINQCATLTDSEKAIVTKIFIKQHMFVYNLGPVNDPNDPYDKMVADLMSLKDGSMFGPKIPENHSFKFSYEIGDKKFMLTKDKRYKNENGSVYYVCDITELRNPIIIDSTFSADEGEFNQSVVVFDESIKPCGMLFNYTIIKYLPNKQEEFSRQVIYVGADKKTMKAYFKTGHSRGGPLSSCGIKYAIKYNDTVFFESSSKRKKLPEMTESFVLTTNAIQKTTPIDTAKPFLADNMMKIGPAPTDMFALRGNDNTFPIGQYRSGDIKVVFYQAKEVPIPGTPAGTAQPKNYGIPSVSVFKNNTLINTARFFFPYNSSKPLRASYAFGNEKIKLFFMYFDGAQSILNVNCLTGEIKILEGNDVKSGYNYYQTLDKKYFAEYDNSILLVQKNSTTKQFRLVKVL